MPKNKIKLSIEESSWLHKFDIEDLDVAMGRHSLEVWEIRMDHSKMEIWMKER